VRRCVAADEPLAAAIDAWLAVEAPAPDAVQV